MPGSQSPSQHGHTATCVSTQRREVRDMDRSVKAIPTTAARSRAKSGVKMYGHSWHPVPLRKIPCLSGHLLFLPVQQPGLASGNSFSNLPERVQPSPIRGCRVQVPTGRSQRGPVAQALDIRGRSEDGSYPAWGQCEPGLRLWQE